MDIRELVVDYSASDFADAVRQLLPKGQYWQEKENEELNTLIAGIGEEFLHVHDEVQLNLLTEIRTVLFGWRINDYQALLYTYVDGLVYDDITTPNMIYVSLENNIRSEQAWREFEEKRLPHTEIHWCYTAATTLHIQAASARHIFNLHKVKA